ncbi:MAG: tryptophan synthase subunit alpha, partial [Planctomycetales bacterium]|nr:tryptophan synthase subunit alpha [Planctomycetales bacterium]
CRARDFSLIHLVTPTTPPERMLRIAESSSGFLYFVSITGITGERNEIPTDLVDKVSWLREKTELPICIGFGISQVEHVRQLAPVADGLIVGSALVRRMAEELPDAERLENVRVLAHELIQAMSK